MERPIAGGLHRILGFPDDLVVVDENGTERVVALCRRGPGEIEGALDELEIARSGLSAWGGRLGLRRWRKRKIELALSSQPT